MTVTEPGLPILEVGCDIENSVIMYAAGAEMLRVAPDGFYVRGTRLEVDENESLSVYKAFKSFLVYQGLSRE
jgi:hypothetical protein